MRNLMLIALLVACGFESHKPEVLASEPSMQERYDAAVNEFTAKHVNERGYVYTLSDGQEEHQGEGGLWACVAMAYLPCDRATGLARHWILNSNSQSGRFRRYEPLPPEYESRPWNFDGETGCQFGLAGLINKCGAPADLAGAWALHRAATKDDLGSGEPMPDQFSFTGKALDHRLGLGEAPSSEYLRAMERAASTWVWSLHARHDSCYRAHLAFRHLLAAEQLGYEVQWNAPLGFCAAARGLDMENIEHRCGRGDLAGWIEHYQPDAYEYEFQRCKWESPDGDGDDTPGLDLIEAIDTVYDVRP